MLKYILAFVFNLCFFENNFYAKQTSDKKIVDDLAQHIVSTSIQMLNHTYGENGVHASKKRTTQDYKKAYEFTFNKIKLLMDKSKFNLDDMLAMIVLDLCSDEIRKNTSLTKVKQTTKFEDMVNSFLDFFAHNYIDKMTIADGLKNEKLEVNIRNARKVNKKCYISLNSITKYTSGDVITTHVKWITEMPKNSTDKIVVLDIVIDDLSFRDVQISQWKESIKKDTTVEEIIKKLTEDFKSTKK